MSETKTALPPPEFSEKACSVGMMGIVARQPIQ